MTKIRSFSMADAKSLAQISNEAFRDEIDRGMQSFTSERFIDFSKKPHVKVYVAEAEREVVGFLILTEGNIETPAQIHLIAVMKNFGGKGIGKKLVKNAIEHVKVIGRKKVKLFTRPWNVAMSKVCIDLGFVPEAYLRGEFLDADIILYSAFSK
ncbi:MAG: GNAT family N-acetyltransferase [Candidatus Bathyarchaeia archaeon]|nr:GNAT family N-acetyltransferase [Candidatus Bathyarchaeia archaeon]